MAEPDLESGEARYAREIAVLQRRKRASGLVTFAIALPALVAYAWDFRFPEADIPDWMGRAFVGWTIALTAIWAWRRHHLRCPRCRARLERWNHGWYAPLPAACPACALPLARK